MSVSVRARSSTVPLAYQEGNRGRNRSRHRPSVVGSGRGRSRLRGMLGCVCRVAHPTVAEVALVRALEGGPSSPTLRGGIPSSPTLRGGIRRRMRRLRLGGHGGDGQTVRGTAPRPLRRRRCAWRLRERWRERLLAHEHERRQRLEGPARPHASLSASKPATMSSSSDVMVVWRSWWNSRWRLVSSSSMFFSAFCMAARRLAFSLASDSANAR